MNGSDTARAFWTVARQRGELRAAALAPAGEDEVMVRTLFSGISRGTERLIFEGRVPVSEQGRMRAPFQGGDFPFPVKYGYAAVGVVEAGEAALLGRTVFVLHPHQDRFVVPAEAARLLPAGLPPRRAVLAANMETALNGLWDSGAGPGDRIVVVGGGAVGLLVAHLAGRLPGTETVLVDVDAARAPLARALGVGFAAPDAVPSGADVVFHASASDAGLATALAVAGDEASVVEMSWYGAGAVAAPLGGAFHAGRLRLISSQVGRISPGRRPRWSYARRLSKALELLEDPRLDALLGQPVPFAQMPDRMAELLAGPAPCPVIAYPE
ncbi:zinc-dependent alcohol dehydrogenase [Ancylobacter lacus]|uniref:zinc-dependent alcohol dehydrogenase n=1 Tax=Ancylobacter lacus TaxID=2579970 RepID=UPI001BCDE491|nr:zinc-binding alcohol dehydrogenase [Ancylobacter lacus]MBS7539188.1 zinc-binding alcohol dehydrogenase [Ancylobacter lacus]